MSGPTFDSVFDYSIIQTKLSTEKSELEAQISSLSAEKTLLESASLYSAIPIVQEKIKDLTLEISRLQEVADAMQDVLTKIGEVTALTALQKEDLLYFFVTLGVEKSDFMAKTLFNYQQGLSDPLIASLRADNTTNVNAKISIAKLIYETYKIPGDRIRIVSKFYFYIR